MLYFIYGDNVYASSNRLAEIKTGFAGDFNIVDGETIQDINPIFISSDTFSLFSSKSLTIVKRFLKNPAKAKLEKALIEKLESINKNDIDLFFWEDFDVDVSKYVRKKKPAKTVTKRAVRSIKTYLLENARVEKYNAPGDMQILNWIDAEFKKRDITNANKFSTLIMHKVGKDQLILASEIEKVSLHLKSEGRTVLQSQDLELFCLYENSPIVWQLTDAICAKDKVKSLDILETMLQNPTDYPLIFASVLKQFKNLYFVKKFVGDRMRLTKYLGLTPFAFSKATNFANNFSLEQLQVLFSKLVNLDYTVKQGKIDSKLGLDLLVATL